MDHSREAVVDHDIRMRRLSRSDSQNRFFSQERLNGDIDYEVRYQQNVPKKEESPRRRRISREEVGYVEEQPR